MEEKQARIEKVHFTYDKKEDRILCEVVFTQAKVGVWITRYLAQPLRSILMGRHPETNKLLIQPQEFEQAQQHSEDGKSPTESKSAENIQSTEDFLLTKIDVQVKGNLLNLQLGGEEGQNLSLQLPPQTLAGLSRTFEAVLTQADWNLPSPPIRQTENGLILVASPVLQ